MEVKINKEIREYAETVFFGLSLRQFVFSIMACVVALGIYFLLKDYFAFSDLSWMCILGASPFAILGFVKYNGMNAEELIAAFIKSELLMPKHIVFKSENYYEDMMKDEIKKIKKNSLVGEKKRR